MPDGRKPTYLRAIRITVNVSAENLNRPAHRAGSIINKGLSKAWSVFRQELVMNSPRLRKHTLSLCLATAAAGACAVANAAFFQLVENNASGLGSANAGGAAIAEDASTVWYNPAGMTRLRGTQFTIAGHYIQPSTKFDASANLSPALGGGAISGEGTGDAGEAALVPNAYYTRPISEKLFFGFGMTVPFGLATDYDDDWVGRYHANRSEIQTINLNAALAYKVSDVLSLGGGINYQMLEATLTQAVDYGSLCALAAAPCAAPGANDGDASVTADDDAWGFNVGAMWELSPASRIGLAYRSKMKYALSGEANYTAPSAQAEAVALGVAGIEDADVSADVTLPATFSVSMFQQLTPTVALLGDVTRTFWSDLPELRIDFDSGQADSVVTLDLEDVQRYSVGLVFTPPGAWMYRAGIALDQTPTPNAERRTARLPDADRKWLALGAGYKSSDAMTIDFSYVYIRADDAEIDKSAGVDPAGEDFLIGSQHEPERTVESIRSVPPACQTDTRGAGVSTVRRRYVGGLDLGRCRA
jgi:long-chain fatty acid transport protein